MNKLNLIKSAFKTIKQNKFRTFLTMLGIIIGVTSVIIMLAIGQGSKESIQENISGMGSNLIMIHPGSEKQGGLIMDRSLSQTLKLEDYEARKRKIAETAAAVFSVNSIEFTNISDQRKNSFPIYLIHFWEVLKKYLNHLRTRNRLLKAC